MVYFLSITRLRCRYDGSATQSAESDRESTHGGQKSHLNSDPLHVISSHLMEFEQKVSFDWTILVILEFLLAMK